MDESGMVMVGFIFIILVVILSGFFIIEGENIDLVGRYEDDYIIPFAPVYGSDDIEYNETGSPINENDEGDMVSYIIGGLLIIGSLILIPFTAGVSLIIPATGLLSGSYLFITGTPGGGEFVSNLPVIGNIFGGINYVATAIGSFGKLVFYSNPIIDQIPILRVLLITPVVLIFFIFTVHIIRGN